MSAVVEHPVLGMLIRDPSGDHVTLRHFPFLPEFARSGRGPAAPDLPLIGDWQRHVPQLVPRVRERPLRGGLHRQGVFEVYVDFAKGASPSAEQAAAFAEFAAAEREVCRNVVDALLRYYRAVRRWLPPLDGVAFPADPDAAALAGVVGFDCLSVARDASDGYSPLRFAWSPAWDEEHGLRVLVYRGQVVMVGTGGVSDMQSWPGDGCFDAVWNREVMTPDEVAAYEAYREDHTSARKSG